MKKSIVQTAAIAFSTSFLFVGNLQFDLPQFPHISLKPGNAWAAEKREIKKVKGKISNISQKAKTIALKQQDQGLMFFKFTEKTQFKDLSSSKELKTGEAIFVEYHNIDGENIIISLQKALAKLPAGTSKVSTAQLAAMLKKKSKDIVIIDARPQAKYETSHIIGAISIPYATLKKEGKKGAQLLAPYKDKQLIFYCGGST